MRKSPRVRRLNADHQSVSQLQSESTIFSYQCKGNPPQQYRLIFQGNGLCQDPKGRIAVCQYHEVLVELGASYPRMVPNLAWRTPIFHPNISHNGVVCLGSYGTHWVPSLTLSEMATMLWDMIRYKNFDTESPYNREAALWAKSQADFQFPVDPRSIRDRVTRSGPVAIPAGTETKPSTPEVRVTRVDGASDDGIEILEVTADGIEIIDAEVAEPAAPSPPTPRTAADDGIVFLD